MKAELRKRDYAASQVVLKHLLTTADNPGELYFYQGELYRMRAKHGLEYEGFAVGTVKDHRLFLICYAGTREYYFPRYEDTAEKIVASIQMP